MHIDDCERRCEHRISVALASRPSGGPSHQVHGTSPHPMTVFPIWRPWDAMFIPLEMSVKGFNSGEDFKLERR